MSRIDEYRRCAAMGMTRAETARHLGVHHLAVYRAAERFGIDFVRHCDRPEFRQAASERMKALWADPEWRAASVERSRARMREGLLNRTIAKPHIRAMTTEELSDYRNFMNHHYRKNDALRAIGRADLVEAARMTGDRVPGRSRAVVEQNGATHDRRAPQSTPEPGGNRKSVCSAHARQLARVHRGAGRFS